MNEGIHSLLSNVQNYSKRFQRSVHQKSPQKKILREYIDSI